MPSVASPSRPIPHPSNVPMLKCPMAPISSSIHRSCAAVGFARPPGGGGRGGVGGGGGGAGHAPDVAAGEQASGVRHVTLYSIPCDTTSGSGPAVELASLSQINWKSIDRWSAPLVVVTVNPPSVILAVSAASPRPKHREHCSTAVLPGASCSPGECLPAQLPPLAPQCEE